MRGRRVQGEIGGAVGIALVLLFWFVSFLVGPLLHRAAFARMAPNWISIGFSEKRNVGSAGTVIERLVIHLIVFCEMVATRLSIVSTRAPLSLSVHQNLLSRLCI